MKSEIQPQPAAPKGFLLFFFFIYRLCLLLVSAQLSILLSNPIFLPFADQNVVVKGQFINTSKRHRFTYSKTEKNSFQPTELVFNLCPSLPLASSAIFEGGQFAPPPMPISNPLYSLWSPREIEGGQLPNLGPPLALPLLGKDLMR